jgi:hypothetical protein
MDENRTIRDFGKQWLKYRDVGGFFGSLGLFEDIIFPFMKPDDLKGCMLLPSNLLMHLKFYAAMLSSQKK